MDAVEEFIAAYPHDHSRGLLWEAHGMLLDLAPQITCGIKWGIPFYTYHKPFCYLNPKPGHLVLGFVDGYLLEDDWGILEGLDRKQVRHLVFNSIEDIYREGVMGLLGRATIFLDA